MTVRVINEYTDIGANYLRTANWVALPGGLAALATAIQAATNSNLLYITQGTPIVGTTTPTDALYPLATDTALFNFTTAGGAGVRLSIPAPIASMFTPYGGINASDPTAAAVIAAVLACLGDNLGNVATIFQGGSKSRRSAEQIGA